MHSHAFVLLNVIFPVYVYFTPLRVYGRPVLGKEATLVSWWCIVASLLSGPKAPSHSRPSCFLALRAAQARPCGKSPCVETAVTGLVFVQGPVSPASLVMAK